MTVGRRWEERQRALRKELRRKERERARTAADENSVTEEEWIEKFTSVISEGSRPWVLSPEERAWQIYACTTDDVERWEWLFSRYDEDEHRTVHLDSAA